MTLCLFHSADLDTVSEALHIAEDRTGDFYKFSFAQWKRHRYDVKTLSNLNENEITQHAFALLNKCSGVLDKFGSITKRRDFYFICLQDHQILKALKRDNNLGLLPLLVYVFTHELVHIVRFCNFYQRFDISGEKREREERIVHSTTHEILKDLSLPQMGYILESYRSHGICDMAIS